MKIEPTMRSSIADFEARVAAVAAGKNTYHGDPCPQGHTLRYVSRRRVCATCAREYAKTSEKMKLRRQRPEVKAALRAYMATPKYKADHKEYLKRINTKGSQYHIASNLRCRINRAIKNLAKRGSAVKDLGCTVAFFKEYIATQFQPGMSWDNWGHDTWHLDHKKPLVSFDLTDREQFLQACHYTNYQPLWATENLAKRWNEDVAA